MLHDLPHPKPGIELATTFDVGPNRTHAQALQAWRVYAMGQYPREAVGVFCVDGAFKPLRNNAPNPYTTILIDPHELIDAGDIVGFVHSHTHPDPAVPAQKLPEAAPSRIDMENQIKHAVPWGISVAQHDAVSNPIWFGDQLPIRPWLQRQFVHGIMDCYAMIRDYHRAMGLPIAEVPRDDRWWLNGEDLYEELFESRGFYRVTEKRPLKDGDVFICAVHSPKRNHAGIVIDRGRRLLHHLGGMLSVASPAEKWVSKLDFIVRHHGLDEVILSAQENAP